MNIRKKSYVEAIGTARPEIMPRHPIWFTDLTFSDLFGLSEGKPPVRELLSVTSEAYIKSSFIVKTPEAVSFEGQMLDGYNLIVEILLKLGIQYQADTEGQSVHIAYFETCKGTGIVLPTHHVEPYPEKYHEVSLLYEQGKLIVKPYIEGVYCTVCKSGNIYVSVSMFIDASVKKSG